MFQIILTCISQLWELLCELVSSTSSHQAEASSASDPMTSTTPQMASSATSEMASSKTSEMASTSSQMASSTTYESASTSSQTPLSSDSPSPPTNWDVFLSFRGEDTRYNFTSHLYSALDRCGVRTFMDDPEPRTQDVISEELIKVIQESKIYIVVLSENYASSPWCLDELVHIFNCHKTMKRLVIPVFYHIDQLHVQHQIGSLGEAFDMARQYSVLTNISEAGIISEIVDRILLQINPKTLDVGKYLVGLDSCAEEVTTLFSSGAKAVMTIGIHGMGGVGKTTLAKAVYNQKYRSFEGSCFLENVKEVSGTEKGLVYLQQQLINGVLEYKNITVDNVDHGMELIRSRICLRKVLIVIDDLDDPKPINFLTGPFPLGSVIIITTRNEDLLDSIEVTARCKVNVLGDAESRLLFSQHAFGNNQISKTLEELSKEIVKCAGGLPLALTVYGSKLLNQSDEEEWRRFSDVLKRVSIVEVEKKLLTSFDSLELVDPMLQDIFLDVSCFFIGWKKQEVVIIMETYYRFVNHYFDILKKRCLLTINDGDELEMHDLLRNMGRNIAHNNSPHEPGKHSRLWAFKDIYHVLKNHKGTEAIKGIIPHKLDFQMDALGEESFTTETFKRTGNLKFLYLKKVNITGSFEQAFKELRWFCWDCCPLKCLPSDFYPQELVTLELPHSNMRTIWEPNMVSHVFGKLKTLNMSYSQDLITTPDFSEFPCLETLNLGYCECLKEVHMSIGSLERLDSLNLGGCKKLISLPDTICDLRALKVLNISRCNSLEALPLQLGNIKSLTKLNAGELSVSKLPESIGDLNKLVELDLSENKNLESLPNTICNLRALKILDIESCSSLEALPTAFGDIEALEELNLSGLIVSKLPDSIVHLAKLVKLDLSNNKNLEILPDTICNLTSLEILNIASCSSLEALPLAIGNLESLKKINGRKLNVSKLPDSIGSLTKLVKLDLRDNKELETLPDNICNLISLEILRINGCEKLETLPDQLWKIKNLRKLDAGRAIRLKKLPDVGSSQIALSLQELNLSSSGIIALPSGFSQLSNLQSLDLSGCRDLLFIPKLPPNLKWIDADDCTSLERLPNLSNLKHLETLKLSSCTGLTPLLSSNTEGIITPSPLASQTHLTLVSSSTPTQYDVFLSFCGKDTRLNFTGHVYDILDRNGIRTFKDDPELRSGEVISDALLDAIRNSKTYIVVFSENYATSPWRLNELAEILNCHRTMRRWVIPVFFNIDPSVVRHQTGSFQKAFKKHQKRFGGEREKLENWQLTLKEVAGFSGHHVSKDRSEADVINEIVDELLLKINPKTLDVAKYPVGLDYRVESITRMLSSDTKGVIKFGIYGMGGVGKTTLAKALFNQLVGGGSFQGSSFLANVREASGTFKGLECLQQQLINDVLRCTTKVEVHNVDQGIKLIEARICSTKVVVVVDDLDDLSHLQLLVGPFASGSVVIITTRDKKILDKTEVETSYQYLVNTLDDADSLALFTQHAFGNSEPSDTFRELSKDILRLAAGLPLALKTFGSYLFNKSEVGWKDYIEKLQRIPNNIQQRLEISLDALESDDPVLKKVFLDIACFFIGWEKQEVVHIMESYYSYADHSIDILKEKCLLTINDGWLGMHDLLQDVGKEIVRNSSPDEPGRRSRLWASNDICDVLKNQNGTEEIECIICRYGECALDGVTLNADTFKRMRKLRFLKLEKVNLTGSLEQKFEDLRWLHWKHCPLECLPSEFYPEKLAVLELTYSNMRTVWELNMVPHVFENLKTVKMSFSKYLITTPDFTKLPCLETLDLECCHSLEEVHISIGSLARLVSLNLYCCVKLRSIPDTICDLRALKFLNISQCNSLEALPTRLGNIVSLTELKAFGLSVSKLPDSIGSLTKLVKLDLWGNEKLETLPATIGNLRSLETLSIYQCEKLETLPDQLWKIPRLRKLDASGVYMLKKLPDVGSGQIALSCKN